MPSSACHSHHRDSHSFPTRRSSDLRTDCRSCRGQAERSEKIREVLPRLSGTRHLFRAVAIRDRFHFDCPHTGGHRKHCKNCSGGVSRSEEHTSELQSPCNLVCRLLLVTATTETHTLSLHDALPICEPIVDLAGAKRSDLKKFAKFFHGCLERGIYFAPSQFETGFISTAHTPEDIENTAKTVREAFRDRKSTRLNSSHLVISYAVFCLSQPPPRLTLFPYTTLFRSANRLSILPGPSGAI